MNDDTLKFPDLKKLNEDLDKLIGDDPDKKAYQEWINSELNKRGDIKTPEGRHNRFIFIQELYKMKVRELNKLFSDLQNELKNLKDKINTLKDIKNDSE